MTSLSERTVPNAENSVLTSASLVLGGRLPINNFFNASPFWMWRHQIKDVKKEPRKGGVRYFGYPMFLSQAGVTLLA